MYKTYKKKLYKRDTYEYLDLLNIYDLMAVAKKAIKLEKADEWVDMYVEYARTDQGDYYGKNVSLIGWRLCTPEEILHHEFFEQKRKDQLVENERQEFERLKMKFDPPF